MSSVVLICFHESRNSVATKKIPSIEPYFTDETFISQISLESSRTACCNDIDIYLLEEREVNFNLDIEIRNNQKLLAGYANRIAFRYNGR